MALIELPDWSVLAGAVAIGIFIATNEMQHRRARHDINKLTFWVKKLLKHNHCNIKEDEYENSLHDGNNE